MITAHWLNHPSLANSISLYQSIAQWVTFPEKKKGKKSKIFPATNHRRFFIAKSTEKSKLSVQIAKVSGQKIETTDQKIRNFQLTKIGEKMKVRMATINFISIQGQ